MCSHTQTCAYRGQWHIGWDILLNGFNERWMLVHPRGFAVPVLYGSWKWSLYHYLVGPFMASITTSDVNERPAVWCLFSHLHHRPAGQHPGTQLHLRQALVPLALHG